MQFYESRREIAAPPSRVWDTLVDTNKLVSGRLGITRLEGRIGLGEAIKLWSEISPARAFALRVTSFEPPRRMVWSGGLPLGLFRGVRQFTLEPVANGTAFQVREEFSGLMLPLIWKSMPDLTPSFEKFTSGIKALVEG